MAITVEDIKKLKELTGIGLTDAKAALVDADGDFDKALTDLIPSAETLAEISALSVKKIYRSKQVLERETGGFEIIGRLMDSFCLSAYHKYFEEQKFTPRQKTVLRLLPESYQSKIEQEGVGVYEMLMIIMDFISSLTDSHAIKLYKTIYGFALPG